MLREWLACGRVTATGVALRLQRRLAGRCRCKRARQRPCYRYTVALACKVILFYYQCYGTGCKNRTRN